MALPPSPLLNLRCLPRPRSSRSVCPPIFRPLYLGGEGRGSRRSRLPAAPSLPAAGSSAHPPKIRKWPNPPTGTGASLSPRPWAGTTSGHRRPLAQGRALPSFTGEYFSGGSGRSRRGVGRSCTQSRRRCGGVSRDGSRLPAGFGLPPAPPPAQVHACALLAPPRPQRSSGLAFPAPAGGRHRPRREKFYLPFPDLLLIKNKRKTFPSGGFRCVRRSGGGRGGIGRPSPAGPRGVGPFPAPGPPPRPAEGGMEGVSQVKRKAAVTVRKIRFLLKILYMTRYCNK